MAVLPATVKQINRALVSWDNPELEEAHEYQSYMSRLNYLNVDFKINKKGHFEIRNTKSNREKLEILEKQGVNPLKNVNKLSKKQRTKLMEDTEIQSFIDRYQELNAYKSESEELYQFGQDLRNGIKLKHNHSQLLNKVRELSKELAEITQTELPKRR